jgi:dipeptidyl aminopeptidase/acylaminoacyl peptidase
LRNRLAFENPRGSAWSPDGQSIYFLSSRTGILKRKNTDGSGEAEALVAGVNTGGFVHDVSPDGKHLLYQDDDTIVLPLAEERKPRRYLESKASRGEAVFSPDGRWVAYSSSESGRKWAVSEGGGDGPRWRRDGREIYWAGPGNTLMAARIGWARADRRWSGRRLCFRCRQPVASRIFARRAMASGFWCSICRRMLTLIRRWWCCSIGPLGSGSDLGAIRQNVSRTKIEAWTSATLSFSPDPTAPANPPPPPR